MIYDNTASESQKRVVGDLILVPDRRQVLRRDRRVDLTPKEFALLEYLLSAPGQVFSKRRIQGEVWGYERDPLTNVVEVYISHLRRKIDDGHTVKLIQTVRGSGYKIAATRFTGALPYRSTVGLAHSADRS